MTTNDPIDLNHTFRGDSIFPGQFWEKPSTGEGLQTILRWLRDRVVAPCRFNLENQTGKGHLISVDGQDDLRPVHLLWDTQLQGSLSWTGTWGVVGRGMVIAQKVDGVVRNVAMVQLGGVAVTPSKYENLAASTFIRGFFIKPKNQHYLLTLETYFLTAAFIEDHAKHLRDCVQDKEALWHRVDDQEVWLAAVKRMLSSL